MTNTSESKEMVASMATEIIDTSKDLNSVLATGKVNLLVRTHYVDTANEIYGVEQLIRSILKANGSIFPPESEQGELRQIVIAGAMFFADIEAEVRRVFGANRYPAVTLRVYLTQKTKDIHTIQLRGNEDTSRTCPKPRAKYYLVE